MAGVRRMGSVSTKPVALSFSQTFYVAMKNIAAARRQFYARDLFVSVVKELYLDRLGVSRKDGDIRAVFVRRDAERLRNSVGKTANHLIRFRPGSSSALVAGIHAIRSAMVNRRIPQTCAVARGRGVDGRHKAGHDGEFARRHPTLAATASSKSFA